MNHSSSLDSMKRRSTEKSDFRKQPHYPFILEAPYHQSEEIDK